MNASGLIYFYALLCLSVVASVVIAGFAISPAFKYFERNNSAEAARKKSLAVAFLLWMFLQVVFCLVIFFYNKQLLM